MKTANQVSRLVDDLAAYWTEPVLEILKAAGNSHQVSVQGEIEAWHSMRALLQNELAGIRKSRFTDTNSLNVARELVVGHAIAALASKYFPRLTVHDLDERIHNWIHGRQSNTVERDLFGAIVGEAAGGTAFKSTRQTDVVSRLQRFAACS